MICVLAGGVGAARLLTGLVEIVPPSEIVAVVNTADDAVFHGLKICPDLDTVTYTLANMHNPDAGWGLAGETWEAMLALERLGGPTWFRLGDRDLGTHLYRTGRLLAGAGLAQVTAEIARGYGVEIGVLPMSEDPVATIITPVDKTEHGAEMGFQEWFVGSRHSIPVAGVQFRGAEEAQPGPGVLEAISTAEVVVVAPSNPIVSIGPLLALPELSDSLRSRRTNTVAISPIVAGKALKGPADTLMQELGHEASVVGVANLYREVAATLIIDTADEHRVAEVEAMGLRCVTTETVMAEKRIAAQLAHTTLEAGR